MDAVGYKMNNVSQYGKVNEKHLSANLPMLASGIYTC